MAFGKSESVQKLLDTSELARLDPLSILRMVESGVIDKEGLKKSLSLEAWRKIIKRSQALSSGEPKPIISNVQHWKLLAEAHHLINSL